MVKYLLATLAQANALNNILAELAKKDNVAGQGYTHNGIFGILQKSGSATVIMCIPDDLSIPIQSITTFDSKFNSGITALSSVYKNTTERNAFKAKLQNGTGIINVYNTLVTDFTEVNFSYLKTNNYVVDDYVFS